MNYKPVDSRHVVRIGENTFVPPLSIMRIRIPTSSEESCLLFEPSDFGPGDFGTFGGSRL